MRKLLILLIAALLAVPSVAMAAESVDELQRKIQEMTLELNELSKRVDKTERHTALDRISWYGDLRVKADTLHYKDVTRSQGVFFDFADFGARAMGGEFGDPGDPASPIAKFVTAFPQQANTFFTGGYAPQDFFIIAAPEKSDINNDILYTTRLRLGMKAKVWENVNFSGRLSMYKNWGDSTGSKVFDSWNSFTMDGTNGGNTTGDWVRVERAYFDWKDIGGSNFYLSIGRRPSTYGPPSQYRENEMRGGTPSGHLVHFNFDGITIGYKLGKHTGVEGQVVRFCYGQGFESEWGNGELFNEIDTDDVHLGGFNIDAINDGTNFLQFTLFRAEDVTDGFKGVIAFPSQFAQQLAPTMWQDLQNFPNFNFVTRVQPSTNIGDIMLGGVGFTREEMNGVNWFASLGWTRTDPNGKAGMFGGLLSDPVYQAALVPDPAGGEMIMPMVTATPSSNDEEDGYSVYVGVQVPAPLGKFGLEYNYGSRYWTPFTQAQDDVVGSKLATRGHAGEAYYIFDINPNMFIKVGAIYYDYKYTGSGSPVGAPVKIEDVQDGTAASILPAVDEVWDGYASLTVKF
ncbi:DUF3373 domain-containing protein [Desulfuromonas sp. TF]|uniref:DUF3373 domain-containing protein n=1 Tax=Desulfuromonas sp. TF TaxID=1232410 RepID=UPI0004072B12|nr:DUF3373 domain-containing protein [Desulfuromonas sp. TF]